MKAATPQSKRKALQREISKIYSGVRFLAEHEISLATRDRDERISRCLLKGAKLYQKNSAKIYTGKLSPGCKTCAEGTWSCIFLNQKCTRTCFFCPTKRKVKIDPPSLESNTGIDFRTPEEYVALLRQFGFRGVGISGGEPFLAFDKLHQIVKAVKKEFGKKIYLWVYTNGDLVTQKKLELLRDAGLDELRVDIAAREYDLSKLHLATKLLKTVSVEIPMIPEDLELLKSILPELDKIGVKHLNLHEMGYSEHNFDQFLKRNYTLIPDLAGNHTVFESEQAALQLLEHALDSKLSLSINYCSQIYKTRFQSRLIGVSWGRYLKKKQGFRPEVGSVTSVGLQRRLRVTLPKKDLKNILDQLRMLKNPRNSWSVTEEGIFIHPSLLNLKLFSKYRLDVEYYFPSTDHKLPASIGAGIYHYKTALVGSVQLPNPIMKSLFKALFLDRCSVDETTHALTKAHRIPKKHSMELREEIIETRGEFRGLEFLPVELPDYC